MSFAGEFCCENNTHMWFGFKIHCVFFFILLHFYIMFNQNTHTEIHNQIGKVEKIKISRKIRLKNIQIIVITNNNHNDNNSNSHFSYMTESFVSSFFVFYVHSFDMVLKDE